MLKSFKIIALCEGISLLILFFVAMPLKYLMNFAIFVRIFGMIHGVLFITYIFLAIWLKINQNWSFKKFLLISLAAVVPFGTFYIEKKYLEHA